MAKYVVRAGFNALIAEVAHPEGTELDLTPAQAAMLRHMIEPAPATESKPESKSRAK